uniref:DBF4-type domain-containing protein n=1 Tax=Seriola dumerili TaxID=41447 RepID=A0A3B4VFX9_SERDU
MHKQQYAEERGLLGKLCPGEKKLEGKTFYLDNVKKRPTALLLEAISLLGGRVESFLHKDVNFVVTGSQEVLKEERCVVTKGGAKGRNEEAQHPIKRRESVLSSEKQRPETPRPMACGSRGKALLEKAIRNNERLQGSSVLANARSWGVKILYADDVLLYLKQLTRESFSMKHKRPERTYTKQQGSHVVKAAALRSPYLKIEDFSRKYKPLHIQSMTLPSLCYLGRFSPFESPPPPQFEKWTEQEEKTREKKKVESSIQDKSQTPLNCNPSPWRQRKKDTSYCECCHQPFTNLDEHLQSDQHRKFVLDPSSYSAVDQLVAEMLPGFNPYPSQQSEETLNRPPTPLPIQDICELEPLTDVETECAVQALRRQDSLFNTHISSLITDCQFPDIQPHASSPAMPVLDVEPQTHASASQQLSLCPGTPCPSPDPYSLPPALSPQLPYSSYILHSPYSEPPVLSPQPCITEEAVEGLICEMDTAETLSESVSAVVAPLLIPRLPSVAVTNAEDVKGSNQDDLLVFSKIICSSNVLKCDKLITHRSRSLPRQSVTTPNPKKRCRSASPECSHSKRRRITVKFGYNCRWTEQGNTSTKPQSDIMAKPEGCSLFDMASCQIIQNSPHPEVSSTCMVETLDLKHAFTTFCVPTVQNFTSASSQMDILGHGGTSVAALSKAKASDPSLRFPNEKSRSALSSQDSQRSLSHSTSVCIESALIPDLATLSPSSSDSDWDCHLLSRLGPTSAAPQLHTEQSCELDKELLHRPCTWMHDTSYESRLHTVLQPATPATSLCGEEMDPSVFSRTVVQIVEVQH